MHKDNFCCKHETFNSMGEFFSCQYFFFITQPLPQKVNGGLLKLSRDFVLMGERLGCSWSVIKQKAKPNKIFSAKFCLHSSTRKIRVDFSPDQTRLLSLKWFILRQNET